MELGQLVNTVSIYLNNVLSIVVTFPAKGKIPITIFMAEGLRGIFEGRGLFVPDNGPPSVDLYRSSSVLSFGCDDKVDKVVLFKQADILCCKIVTINTNKKV